MGGVELSQSGASVTPGVTPGVTIGVATMGARIMLLSLPFSEGAPYTARVRPAAKDA